MRQVDEAYVACELNSAQQESKRFRSQPPFSQIFLSAGTLMWWFTNESPSVWTHPLPLYKRLCLPLSWCCGDYRCGQASKWITCFICVLPEMDFCNWNQNPLVVFLYCGNMPSQPTCRKHPFKLAISMVITIAVVTIIVRNFNWVSKPFICYFTQVIFTVRYFFSWLKRCTFTFCSVSSTLSHGGLGCEPYRRLCILSQTHSYSDGRIST